MGKQLEDNDDDDTYTHSMPYNFVPADDVNATVSLVRTEFEGHTIA